MLVPSKCPDTRWWTTGVDPLYATPVIDSRTEETTPVVHHRVSGHFEGTNIQFTIYLPPADQWEGRFFQWTYPIAFTPEQDTSRATDRAIGFALASGGYAVQAGNAGVSLGYRHTAAAAKFARTIAAAYYGTDEHIYGYLYGGSGGSYQTIGAAENSTGVWDGYVPYIIGTPMSSPYTGLIRAFARLLLADKAEQIKDAVSPGGSGDPYADLDAGEAAMLRELISFGVPLAAWQNPSYVLMQDPTWFADGGLGFGATIRSADPGYVHDFWNTPGYLGTEDSPLGDAVRAALAEAGDTVDNRWDIAVRAYYRRIRGLRPVPSGRRHAAVPAALAGVGSAADECGERRHPSRRGVRGEDDRRRQPGRQRRPAPSRRLVRRPRRGVTRDGGLPRQLPALLQRQRRPPGSTGLREPGDVPRDLLGDGRAGPS
jgi:hypothetical protein